MFLFCIGFRISFQQSITFFDKTLDAIITMAGAVSRFTCQYYTWVDEWIWAESKPSQNRVKTESKPSQRPTTNSGMRVSSRERTMKREGCDVARVERGAGPNSLLTGRKLDEMISGLRLTLAKDRPGAWEQQRWSPASVGWSRVEPRGASRWGRQAAAKRCAGSEPVAPERFSVPESPVRLTS